MSPIGIAVAAFLAGWGATFYVGRRRIAERAEFIRSYPLPQGLYEKLRQKRPQLDLKDCQLVGRGLRQFFLAYLKGGRKPVSMPSQVTDDLWHEFILYTKHYHAFCNRAFGQFMHHVPAAVLGSNRRSNEGLRRVWWYACREENINPKKATRLPLLFALDAKLNIPDGFRYSADCRKLRDQAGDERASAVHCGGDFSDPAYDGGTTGLGDDSDGFFGGGDSGAGDGGSGCDGGGCGSD